LYKNSTGILHAVSTTPNDVIFERIASNFHSYIIGHLIIAWIINVSTCITFERKIITYIMIWYVCNCIAFECRNFIDACIKLKTWLWQDDALFYDDENEEGDDLFKGGAKTPEGPRRNLQNGITT